MQHASDNKKKIFTPKPVALGDALEKVFKPIAKVVGKTGCGGCRRRQAKLNKLVPNINPFA